MALHGLALRPQAVLGALTSTQVACCHAQQMRPARRPSAHLVSAPAPLQIIHRSKAPSPHKRVAPVTGSTVASGDELKLLGTWRGPFALRVRLALNFKGLSYEYLEEDLANKSDLLLNSNPVNKKYIDEVYSTTGPSLLPADPYERARARFWATYIDQKLVEPWWKMFAGKTDKEKHAGTKQTLAAVEVLEGASRECSKGKPFFGGDSVGYVDVVLGGMVSWMRGTELLCGVDLIDEAKTPLLTAWVERFGGLDPAKVVLPDVGRLVEFAKMKRAQKALI